MFTLQAAVMWTVNDFPAYMACSVCKEDVTSGWHAEKVCYLGHRQWLPWDHKWPEKDKDFLYKYDLRDGSLARRGIACWACQLLLDVSNQKASWRAEKNCTQQGEARTINYRGLGSI
ncbi:hypothetical protein L3X38_012440 [Prunus dulcis]|uniref:Uncharacterized protein n=1 Tax=Prunus dulcis TaxID=3755 RepID=A0AAD4WK26_PRUDU|nr:hypothetical protein L3X38_012440 [Prunus dulcis]